MLLSAFQESRSSAGAAEDVELQWTWNPSARIRADPRAHRGGAGAETGIECETRADEGDPADVLVRLARECGADLLVIGNKGIKRRVLGSVPNTVTHKADCSVLVVKTT